MDITRFNKELASKIANAKRYEKDGEKALFSLKGILNESAIERLKTFFSSKTELPSEEKKVYDHFLNHWYLYRVDMKLTRDELPDILEQFSGFDLR